MRKLYRPSLTETPLIQEKPSNLHRIVTESKDVKTALLGLSSCLQGVHIVLGDTAKEWEKYSEVWTLDREVVIHRMEVSRIALVSKMIS